MTNRESPGNGFHSVDAYRSAAANDTHFTANDTFARHARQTPTGYSVLVVIVIALVVVYLASACAPRSDAGDTVTPDPSPVTQTGETSWLTSGQHACPFPLGWNVQRNPDQIANLCAK